MTPELNSSGFVTVATIAEAVIQPKATMLVELDY